MHINLQELETEDMNQAGKTKIRVSLCLRTTPRQRMDKWKYSSMDSWPRHPMDLRGKLLAPAALTPQKGPRYLNKFPASAENKS